MGNLYVFKGYKGPLLLLFDVAPYNALVYLRDARTVQPPGDWEAEGLTVWDLTMAGAAISGHLHVQILENETDNDSMHIVHFFAVDPLWL